MRAARAAEGGEEGLGMCAAPRLALHAAAAEATPHYDPDDDAASQNHDRCGATRLKDEVRKMKDREQALSVDERHERENRDALRSAHRTTVWRQTPAADAARRGQVSDVIATAGA